MLVPANIKNDTGGLERDATNFPSVQMRMEWKVVGPVGPRSPPAMYYLERLLKGPGCDANYEKYMSMLTISTLAKPLAYL